MQQNTHAIVRLRLKPKEILFDTLAKQKSENLLLQEEIFQVLQIHN